jgi:hypothetical protein
VLSEPRVKNVVIWLAFFFENRCGLLGGISKLAWLAHIEQDNKVIKILCGPWVATNNRFFVEGAWHGEFLKGGFDIATSFFGSRGMLTPLQSMGRSSRC